MLNCSPLYGSRVVLRRLTSAQAQRRGKRAIEVGGVCTQFLLGHLNVQSCNNYLLFLGFEEVSST